MKTFVSNSREDTVKFAADFAKTLKKGSVVAFLGGLGMGKTAFVSGLAKGLGIDADVTSPTFSIVNEYSGSENVLYHFDMYRVDNWDDLYSTGYFDYLDGVSFLAVEWSENIFGALEDDAIIVEFEKIGENSRKITIYNKGDGFADTRS